MNTYGSQRRHGVVWKAGLGMMLLWAASAAGQHDAGLPQAPIDGGAIRPDVLRPFQHDETHPSDNPSTRATRACLANKIEAAYVAATKSGWFFLYGRLCPKANGPPRHTYRTEVSWEIDHKFNLIRRCVDEWAASHPITELEKSNIEEDLKQFKNRLIDLQFNAYCPTGGQTTAQTAGRGAGGCSIVKGVGWR